MVAVSAQRLDGDRLVVALAGDHEPRGEVEQQPGAAGERECGERDPVDERVDVEVAAEPGARRRRASGRRSVRTSRLGGASSVVVGSIVSDIVSLLLMIAHSVRGGEGSTPSGTTLIRP